MGQEYESVQPSCDWVMLDVDTRDGLFHVGNKRLFHPGKSGGHEPSRGNYLISPKPDSHPRSPHHQTQKRRTWQLHNNKHVGLNINAFGPWKGVPNSRHCQTIINRQFGDFLH